MVNALDHSYLIIWKTQ